MTTNNQVSKDIWERNFFQLYNTSTAVKKNLSRLRTGFFLKDRSSETVILDLFCGKGETSIGLSNIGFKRIIRGDFSYYLLLQNSTNNERVCLNAAVLPFKDGSFDAIIIQGGLHHLKSIGEIIICLTEAKRILRSNGFVFISEPGNTLFLKTWLLLMNKTNLWKLFKYSRHWHDLYIEEIESHSQYLSAIPSIINYYMDHWNIDRHTVGLVTEFFTLRKTI